MTISFFPLLLIFGKLDSIKGGDLKIKSGLVAFPDRVAGHIDHETLHLLSVSKLSLTVLAFWLAFGNSSSSKSKKNTSSCSNCCYFFFFKSPFFFFLYFLCSTCCTSASKLCHICCVWLEISCSTCGSLISCFLFTFFFFFFYRCRILRNPSFSFVFKRLRNSTARKE